MPFNANADRRHHNLLTRLVNGWPQSRLDELMPWHGAAAKAD